MWWAEGRQDPGKVAAGSAGQGEALGADSAGTGRGRGGRKRSSSRSVEGIVNLFVGMNSIDEVGRKRR